MGEIRRKATVSANSLDMRKNDKEASKPGPRELQLGRSFYPIDDSLLSLPILRQHGKPQKTSTRLSERVRSVSQ